MTGSPSSAATTTTAQDTVPPGAWRALLLVTLGFGVNFWAWALLSPLGPVYGLFTDEGVAVDGGVGASVRG